MPDIISRAEPTLVYFGHHKCATQYIKAVVRSVAVWLGLYFETVDWAVEPAPVTAVGAAPHHSLHIQNQGFGEPAADVLYFANANAAAVVALNERGGYRGFHVIRDPRDILVSGYFSHLHSHPITENNQERIFAWRQQLAAATSVEEGLLLELAFASANFANMAGWNYADPHIYETSYERLTAAPRIVFSEIFSFLGLSVPRLGLLALAGLLVNRGLRYRQGRPMPRRTCLPQPLLRHILARNAFARKAGGRTPGQEDVYHHYRKGVAGDWQIYFTPRVTAAFKERYGDLLLQLGYESTMDWGEPS